MEVERKFPLRNHEEVIEQLSKIGKLIFSEQEQRDDYFVPAHKNFLEEKPIKEWLRIRKTNDSSTLNYKQWHFSEGKATHCDEHETIIDDESIRNILDNLNFSKVISVSKKRSSWMLDGVEVSIDYVVGLGYFIELEAKKFNDIVEANELIDKSLNQINAKLGPQDFKGYPHLMLEKKKLL